MARMLSFRQALSEAFRQEMERDPTVIFLGEDIAGGKGAPGRASNVRRRSRNGPSSPLIEAARFFLQSTQPILAARQSVPI